MTTSSYMPDVKVEIAFDSGYATPAGARTWTDVSAYVELRDKIAISHGRADEFGVTDPNRLTLTLDNRDGRFTPGLATSPYYPNVKLGRPIRVTSTPIGGTPSVRFVGYVDEWPVEWAGSDAYASSKITASSRMARLGFGATLGSVASEGLRLSGARHMFPLNEPAGSEFATDLIGDVKLLQTTSPGTAPTFGAATGLFGGATGYDSTGPTLVGLVPDPQSSAAPSGVTIEGFVTTDLTTGNQLAFEIRQTTSGFTGAQKLSIGLNNGAPFVTVGGGSSEHYFYGTEVINDGLPHHCFAKAELVGSTTTVTLYVDGELVATGTKTTLPAITPAYLAVGLGGSPTLVVANVATGTTLSGLDDRVEAGLTGFNGRTASENIAMLASFVGIDPAEVVADSGTHPMAPIDTSGKSVIDAMRVAEETEGGVLYDGRDNTLQFRGRDARYNAPPAISYSAALRLEAGLVPKLDRTSLTNEVSATAADGKVATVSDQASIDDYGYARSSVNILSTYDDAYQAAAWRVSTHSEPQPRIPSLGVNITPWTPSVQATALSADIGTKLTLSGLPAQAPASSLDFFVEGYTETIGPESYVFDFNVSPAADYAVFILDSPTKGVLDDANYPLAY